MLPRQQQKQQRIVRPQANRHERHERQIKTRHDEIGPNIISPRPPFHNKVHR